MTLILKTFFFKYFQRLFSQHIKMDHLGCKNYKNGHTEVKFLHNAQKKSKEKK